MTETPTLAHAVATLRRAATVMTEQADAATPGPWLADVLGSEGYVVRERDGKVKFHGSIPRPIRVARCGYEDWDTDKANAEHIASWTPEVARTVAILLENEASLIESTISDPDLHTSLNHARTELLLDVATTYLQGEPR